MYFMNLIYLLKKENLIDNVFQLKVKLTEFN